MANFYEVAKSQEKENITVLCTYSADGKSLPPMIIYPYKRIPTNLTPAVDIVGRRGNFGTLGYGQERVTNYKMSRNKRR